MSSKPAAQAGSSKLPAKFRVLFLCIGNSCRSQMAEAFAKTYGSDVMEVRSAGLSPATSIAPLTRLILEEHNISSDSLFPKGLDAAIRERWDYVINMSGLPVELRGPRILEWRVQDPIGLSPAIYRQVASQIESRVMQLILDLRDRAAATSK